MRRGRSAAGLSCWIVAFNVAAKISQTRYGAINSPAGLPQPQELACRGRRDRRHDEDHDFRERDVVHGEEDRRPGEIERQLDEEQGQRRLPPRRRRLDKDHRQRDPISAYRIGQTTPNSPAGRHEARLLQRVEPADSRSRCWRASRSARRASSIATHRDDRDLPPALATRRFSHSSPLPAGIRHCLRAR